MYNFMNVIRPYRQKPSHSRLQIRAFTLVELMVTLLIVAIVLSLSLMTLMGYIPKQRLLSSRENLANLIQRAQSEANARTFWSCITFRQAGGLIEAELFVDEDHSYTQAPGTAPTCGATGDLSIQKVQLKSRVEFPTCSGVQNVKLGCDLWFDSTGAPRICDPDCISGGTASCQDGTYQIILSTPDLDERGRSRELEIISGGGIVKLVKVGDKGLAASIYARGPGLEDGCE